MMTTTADPKTAALAIAVRVTLARVIGALAIGARLIAIVAIGSVVQKPASAANVAPKSGAMKIADQIAGPAALAGEDLAANLDAASNFAVRQKLLA